MSSLNTIDAALPTAERGPASASQVHRALALLVPAFVYACVAALVTWPLVLHPRALLGALQGPGDPYLNLWILGWDLRTLSSDPRALFTGRIFDANIFHPAVGTLAYSDHLLLQAIGLWPLYAVTGDRVLCYNILLLLSLVASALAMHACVRCVIGDGLGAYAAGIAWGFAPYHVAHLLHLQLQALYLLPLTFLFLHRLAAGARRRDALWLGLTVGAQAAASVYYGVIGTLGLMVSAIALVATTGSRRVGLLVRRGILASAVAAVVAGPFLWPYWKAQEREGFGRNLYEASQHAANMSSYRRVPPENLLYGRSGLLSGSVSPAERTGAPLPEGPEQQLFPGLLVIALAGVGVLRARRAGRSAVAVPLIAVVGIGTVLSLGPDGIRPIYAAFHRIVFGFQAIRAPARFSVLVLFGVAGLAAIGMGELFGNARTPPAGWRDRRQRLGVLVVCLMVVEYANGALPYVAAPASTSAVGVWLRDAPEPGAVLYLPIDLDLGNTPFMVQSLEHGRPIVNGYSGQRPSFFVPVVESLRAFPSSEALRTLYDLDVRFVVSPLPIETRETPATANALIERARIDGTVIYEVRASPGAEAGLAVASDPPPPPPGVRPFQIGEEAIYRVLWAGGLAPRGLAAGSATISVTSPPAESEAGPPLAFVFTLTAETADWVSRFFEARDRFETHATNALLPSVHLQTFREGRRSLDRVVSFDQTRHVVRVGTGADRTSAVRGAPALPMPAEARDPIAALFYARTLTLEPGTQVRFPVNDVGRNLVVELRALAVEEIDLGDQRVPALRIEPRLVYRLERRQPLDVVVWLSRDARRLPLVVEVSAAFGTLRVELASYRAGGGT